MVDRIGQQLGNYRLTRLLRQDSCAEVYLGEYTLLGTMVAIKVLHTQVTQDEVAQFQQEARLLANFKQSSSVRIFDFDLDGQISYLVIDSEQASQDEFSMGSAWLAHMISEPRVARRAMLIGAATATAMAAFGGNVFAVSQRHFDLPRSFFQVPTATGKPKVPVYPTHTSAMPDPTPLHGHITSVTNLSDNGVGSLRWALANVASGGTITFNANLKGTIVRPGSQLCRDLLISKSLTIRGPGAKLLALSGSGHDRVFSVSSGVSVTISGLTIEKGTQGCAGYPGGGAIYNEGTLTLSNCTISNSTMPDGQGGGIDNEGTLTLNNCIVTGNSGSGGQNIRGGGIYNGIVNSRSGGRSELTLINSTVTGNVATGAYGDSGFGGGIYNAAGSKLTLTNSKVIGNTATGPKSIGGGIYNEGTLLLKNSTVTGNSASLTKSNNIYNTGAGTVKYS